MNETGAWSLKQQNTADFAKSSKHFEMVNNSRWFLPPRMESSYGQIKKLESLLAGLSEASQFPNVNWRIKENICAMPLRTRAQPLWRSMVGFHEKNGASLVCWINLQHQRSPACEQVLQCTFMSPSFQNQVAQCCEGTQIKCYKQNSHINNILIFINK